MRSKVNLYNPNAVAIKGGTIYTDLLRLNDSAWDDLRFPANAINPPGAAADPTRNTSTGMLEFSGSADNVIAGIAQMPHAWKAGTTIYPHLHLRFPTANTNTSRWRLDYDVASSSVDFTNNYGTYTSLTAVSQVNPNNAKAEGMLSLGTIGMAGFGESSVIMWKLTRLAASDDLDTDTSAVVLLEFDIHYEINKLGSDNEIPT